MSEAEVSFQTSSGKSVSFKAKPKARSKKKGPDPADTYASKKK